MRSILQLLTFALICCTLATLVTGTASVRAMGAPTDNITMPNVPDQSQNEMKPAVEYFWMGPTSQSDNKTPNLIPSFIGASEQKQFAITAQENWYLDLDINLPGWLYIYEYFPDGDGLQGEWIAYQWELLQSGIWRLGPFTLDSNELEGQHIYRFWFYSDGQWAAGDPDSSQSYLIYWTYSKGEPEEQVTGQPPQPLPAPLKEATFSDKAYEFIKRPLVISLGILILAILAALGLYLSKIYTRRYRSRHVVSLPDEIEHEELPTALASAIALANIVLPNGTVIQLANNNRVIGRADLARALNLDELGLISRRHFEVKSEDEQFYIEDLDSANGTKLNGENISGKGPVILNDDDIIEPAGITQLKFVLV